jgi:opacity protein-like surface antigen
MRKLTTALLAAAAISGAALAEGNTASSGFYLGANAGVANTNVKYSYANTGVQASATYSAAQLQQNWKGDAGKMAGVFGAFAGYGVVVGQGAYFGGELFAGLDTTKVTPYDDSATGIAGGFFKTTVKRTNFYGLAARVGYMVTPSTLAYIRLGVEAGKWKADVLPNSGTITQQPASQASTSAQQAASNKTFSKSKNSISFAPGLGLEAYITKNMFLRAEYSYLFGPTISGLNQDITGYPNGTFAGTGVAHSFKITQHQFKIGVGYKF